MLNRKVVQKALKQTWARDNNPGSKNSKPGDGQSSIISRLIYDIYGGEILKTRMKEDWHFYNRIDGERIDFTLSEMVNSSKDYDFRDIPSTPYETYNYSEQEDYSTFFIRFIRAFEEAVGLKKYRKDLTE